MNTVISQAITMVLVLAPFVLGGPSGEPTQAQEGTTIGIDASSQGNGATSLGTIESCASVATDETFTVDVFVENVTDLLAWEAYVDYDHSIVQVIDRDVELFQAAGTEQGVIDVSDSIPFDADRPFRIGATTITDPPVGESGSGVLARLTLKAIAAGNSTISVAPVDRNGDGEPEVGPFLRNVDADVINDVDEDHFFDGPFVEAEVAVDRECGADAVASPTQREGDGGGGWDWWMTALIIAGGIIVLLALTYVLQRRRGGGALGRR